MRILAVSTYDLGTQPLILARLKSRLAEARYRVKTLDLSLVALTNDDISRADVIIFSIPMHTALALTKELVEKIRMIDKDMPLCFFGLYGPAAISANLLAPKDIAIAGGGFETLLSWLDSLTQSGTTKLAHNKLHIDLGPAKPSSLIKPDRTDFLPLDNYMHYMEGEQRKTVATIETVYGCSHHCKHCPVPVIYNGRTRKFPEEEILADAAGQIGAGAEHIHFSDPDFFNRPDYAMKIVSLLKKDFPGITFDATIKISHILKYAHLLEELSEQGCRMIITALEQVTDSTLQILDKGHTKKDSQIAFELLRNAGIEPRPSLLPFTPWTKRQDLLELLDFILENDLAWNVDPVQWSIRLLLPPGSLLLEASDKVLTDALDGLSEDGLSYNWHSPDPILDLLAVQIGRLAEKEAASSPFEAYFKIRELVYEAFEIKDPGAKIKPSSASKIPGDLRPRLSENWFCCAAPTENQKSQMTCR